MLNVHLFVFRIKSKCCVEFSNSDQASSDQVYKLLIKDRDQQDILDCILIILMTFNHDNDRQARRGWLWTASPGPPSTPRPSEWHFLQRFAAPTFLIRLASVYFWLNLVFCKPQILTIFHPGGDEKVGRGRRRRGSSWACWR